MYFTKSLSKFFIAAGFVAIHLFNPVKADDRSNEAIFKRLSELASNGNAEIKYHLGMFLNNGIGTPQDTKRAFQLFSESAELGNQLAAYKVGCYLAGQFPGTVPVNEVEALKFKLRAAEAGYDLAQHDVGIYYGKKRDIQNALIWWERASRQGNVAATAYLANYYSNPASPAPDLVRSYALAVLLKSMAPEPTKELLAHIAQLEAKLSAEQKTEAEAFRASWLTGKTPLSLQAQAGLGATRALLSSFD